MKKWTHAKAGLSAGTNWTYEKAGVPHLKGDPAYNRDIVKMIKSTHIPGVMGSATGFAALFDIQKYGIKNPLIVSSTDGVGTKLEVACLQKRHDTIGIDLVAMCVNDILTCGAKPVVFLDYIAAGKYDNALLKEILKGVVRGCQDAGCALVGGETAIMPGFYTSKKNEGGHYDVAGFSIGLVDRKKIITGDKIQPGDAVIGLASSGTHSNGYSLIRKVFSKKELAGETGKKLLTPTKIYVRPVLDLMRQVSLKGIVNITGGGFVDNLPRVLPKGLGAHIRFGSWPVPEIFNRIQVSGNIGRDEMARTFNMGIGLAVVVKKSDEAKTVEILKKTKIRAWKIGEITKQAGITY